MHQLHEECSPADDEAKHKSPWSRSSLFVHVTAAETSSYTALQAYPCYEYSTTASTPRIRRGPRTWRYHPEKRSMESNLSSEAYISNC